MANSFAAQLTDALEASWPAIARPNQLPPPGDWQVWLLLAGRGFGKTRTGAEWVRDQIMRRGRKRVALVAPTAADVRDVMVEGEIGVLAIGPEDQRPRYEPSKRRLTWSNGAIATTYSADEPERLGGRSTTQRGATSWPLGATRTLGTCSCLGFVSAGILAPSSRPRRSRLGLSAI